MRIIKLTNGGETIVDDEDFEELNRLKWRRNNKGYAYSIKYVKLEVGKYTNKFTLIHRLLCPNNETTDHINGNKLDNRKSNLRPATRSQNQANRGVQSNNTSGYKGVHYDKLRNKWRARVVLNRKGINLGDFKTPEEAALAYNTKAKELFGDFALLNIVLTPTSNTVRQLAI